MVRNFLDEKSLNKVLVHCTLVRNMYQYDLRILYTLTGNKLFGSLINISPFESQYMVY